MEIEALEAILMDDFKEICSSESGLNTSNRCFQITLYPQDDEADESTVPPVQLGLIFSHTENFPDEPPLIYLKSLRRIPFGDLKVLKEKLEKGAAENLDDDAEEDEAAKDEVIVPHGEAETVETFLAWRERFEAELALQRAKLMPDSALAAPKEKKHTSRQWFDSGRASSKSATIAEGSVEEEEEDIDFDEDDFDDDEEDMLEHYLAEKSDTSSHSSKRAN
ncbi:Rwd domain-containing protein [Striga asiatica]|uniref:Rwd domain-containing protein n=1 Tax=Striga asiatica TaxID=4170 RepID=A0A5A7QNL4_STRAF|nr:Rwd domain-containing protein [Striga asiatica]